MLPFPLCCGDGHGSGFGTGSGVPVTQIGSAGEVVAGAGRFAPVAEAAAVTSPPEPAMTVIAMNFQLRRMILTLFN